MKVLYLKLVPNQHLQNRDDLLFLMNLLILILNVELDFSPVTIINNKLLLILKEFDIQLKCVKEFLDLHFQYYRIMYLYHYHNKEVILLKVQTLLLPINTNPQLFHDPIFSTFLELNKQQNHRMIMLLYLIKVFLL